MEYQLPRRAAPIEEEGELVSASAALDRLPTELLELILDAVSVLDRLALRCSCRRLWVAIDALGCLDARDRDGHELAEAMDCGQTDRDALVFFEVSSTVSNSGFGDVGAVRLKPRGGYHWMQLWFTRPVGVDHEWDHACCHVSPFESREDFARYLWQRRLLDPYSYGRMLERRLACTWLTSEDVRMRVRKRFVRLVRDRASREFAHLLRDASNVRWLTSTPFERVMRRASSRSGEYERAVIRLCGLVELLELVRDAGAGPHGDAIGLAVRTWRCRSYERFESVPFSVTEEISGYCTRGRQADDDDSSWLLNLAKMMIARLRLMYQQLA